MNTIVFEHVRISELPAAWRSKLSAKSFTNSTQVTVRIEEEAPTKLQKPPKAAATNPIFGMWRDKQDAADVAAYARELRAPRLNADGTRRKRS